MGPINENTSSMEFTNIQLKRKRNTVIGYKSIELQSKLN